MGWVQVLLRSKSAQQRKLCIDGIQVVPGRAMGAHMRYTC